jgi:hypothetical protein
MYTLQNIKDEYYTDLALGLIGRIGLEEYINEYYLRCYDDNLEFLGYDRRYI